MTSLPLPDDTVIAEGLMEQPQVVSLTLCGRAYRREWMRLRRADPVYREAERAQQRAYRRELRVGAVMARAGRFEDQPGAD